MVLHDDYCDWCAEKFANISWRLCKPCQANDFKNYFTNWTCENEIIDNFIQEIQLKIDNENDVAFDKWIPYSQINSIKRISKGYSAAWNKNEVVLRYLYSNSQQV